MCCCVWIVWYVATAGKATALPLYMNMWALSQCLTFRWHHTTVPMGIVVDIQAPLSKYVLNCVWLVPVGIWGAGKCEECLASPCESSASNPPLIPVAQRLSAAGLVYTHSLTLKHVCDWSTLVAIMTYRHISTRPPSTFSSTGCL